MTSNNNANLPSIPAQRYFNLQEVCELVQISPAQFQERQQRLRFHQVCKKSWIKSKKRLLIKVKINIILLLIQSECGAVW